jgi:hypothetical protein
MDDFTFFYTWDAFDKDLQAAHARNKLAPSQTQGRLHIHHMYVSSALARTTLLNSFSFLLGRNFRSSPAPSFGRYSDLARAAFHHLIVPLAFTTTTYWLDSGALLGDRNTTGDELCGR